jgi:uncharacterized protein (TIGR03492 family)
MASLLVLSNGCGEDTIAGRIIDRLRESHIPDAAIHAWPMVGDGDALRTRGLTLVGISNRLPSAGFATLSARWMWRDLRAGWLAVHAAQIRAARAMRHRYAAALVVGDVVPMAAAVLADLPFVFVGCAKSAYYGRKYAYSRLELRWLRRHARHVFPRDGLTARSLTGQGIPARDAGNPMMDDLAPEGPIPGVADDGLVLGALPGSRWDAADNVSTLMTVAEVLAGLVPSPRTTHVVCAVARAPKPEEAQRWQTTAHSAGWEADRTREYSSLPEAAWCWRHHGGLRFHVVSGRFAAVLHRARVVIGLAGTANEQAVGLGKPLVTFPTTGVFDDAYLRMKMRFFGESALAVPRDPAQVGRAVVTILADPALAARMGAAGQARMGSPGASAAIAAAVIDSLPSTPRRKAAP